MRSLVGYRFLKWFGVGQNKKGLTVKNSNELLKDPGVDQSSDYDCLTFDREYESKLDEDGGLETEINKTESLKREFSKRIIKEEKE